MAKNIKLIGKYIINGYICIRSYFISMNKGEK